MANVIQSAFVEMQNYPFPAMTDEQIIDILSAIADHDLFDAKQCVARQRSILAEIKVELAHARQNEQCVLKSCPRRDEHYGNYDAFAATLIDDHNCAYAMGIVDVLEEHMGHAERELEIAEKNLRVAVQRFNETQIELNSSRRHNG